MSSRTETHITDTKAIKKILNIIPDHWVIRELSERDYGIDLMVEIFYEDGFDKNGKVKYESSGNVFYLQVKGTSKKLRFREDEISFQLDRKTLLYVEKFTTPFLLVRLSTDNKHNDDIYFVWLQRYIKDKLDKNIPNWRDALQKSFSIKIPKDNKLSQQFYKVESIASHIKYIEEYSEFYEIFSYLNNYFTLIHNVDTNEKLYNDWIQELRRLKRFSTLMEHNNCCVSSSDIQDIIDFIIEIKNGLRAKDALIEYPNKVNLNLLLSEKDSGMSVKAFIAENEGKTIY